MVLAAWLCLPEKIVSDRESQFVSSSWQSLNENDGYGNSNVYGLFHPQTDDQSERIIFKQWSKCCERFAMTNRRLGMDICPWSSLRATIRWMVVRSSHRFSWFLGGIHWCRFTYKLDCRKSAAKKRLTLFRNDSRNDMCLRRHTWKKLRTGWSAKGIRRRRDHNYRVGDDVWLQLNGQLEGMLYN